MKVFRILFLFVLLLSSGLLSGQDKNIVDLFRSDSKAADRLFMKKEYSRAREYYSRLVKKSPSNSFYTLRLAECYRLLNNTEEAEKWYRQVVESGGVLEKEHELHYAEVLMSNDKPGEARLWFEKYNRHNGQDKRGERMVQQVNSIEQLFKDSLAYTVNPVDFNSPFADFGPVFYKKGIVFLSARRNPIMVRSVNSADNTYFLDLYYTEKISDSSFAKPVRFHQDLSFSLHEGPITFFDGGKKAVLGKNLRGSGPDGVKKLGLYYGEYVEKGNKWVNLKELPFCNKSYNVTHPYFESRTNTLYFASDMPGGFGGMDIYKVKYSDGEWLKPVNLGNVINTEKNETFPFVTRDSVLYFSSDGHAGLGGIDIIKCDLRDKPLTLVNPGYPLNSPKDDVSFALNGKGSEGFFASNRKSGGLDDDIYRVIINRTKVEGSVVDKLKFIEIKDARVTLINADNGDREDFVKTDQNGSFVFYIVPGRKYKAEVYADGFKPEVLDVFNNDLKQKTIKVRAEMDKFSKTYVKGRVVYHDDAVGRSRIQIFDPLSDSVEVLYTNNQGEFQCQINTDTLNILIADNQGKLGIFVAHPVKRKRKASSIHFIEIPLGTLDSIRVQGVFKEKTTGLPDPGAQLILRNELTNRESVLPFNEKGEFSVKLWDTCKYSIFLRREDGKVLIHTFEPWKSRTLELIR